MSQKTRTALKTGLTTYFPDNTTGLITPLATRTQNTDQIDSAGNLIDVNTWTALNNFTGGLQVNGANVTGTGVELIITESDFEVQDATTITLESKKIYLLGADLSTGKRFVVEDGAVLTGLNILGYILTYTGTGDMFTGTDADFTIREIRLSYPNANQAYNFTDTVGGQKLFLSEKVRTVSGTKYGTFNNMQTILEEGSAHFSLSDGITLTGSDWAVISFDKVYMDSTSATFIGIDLGTAISPTIEIDDFIAINPTAGAIGIKAAANSANLPSGNIGSITGCNFSNIDTPISGISESDTVRWRVRRNAGVTDTIIDGLLSLNSNVTPTVIATPGTAVKLTGTWVCERQSLTTCNTNGRITFLSETPEVLPIDGALFVAPASGTNKSITVYLAKNGAIIPNSGRTVRADSGDPEPVPIIWQDSYGSPDYIEIWVANNTDTISIIGSSGMLRAR